MMRLHLFKAIRNDAILMSSVLFAFIPQFFVMYQTNFYMDLDWSSYSTIALTVLSSLANLVFFWRLFGIIKLLRTGSVLKGTVVWKTMLRDRGSFGIRYEVQNVRYEKKMMIMATKETNCINNGNEVTLVLNPNNPKQAIVGSLVSDDLGL
jgi:hypothetical protein